MNQEALLSNQNDKYLERYKESIFSTSQHGKRWRWQIHAKIEKDSKIGFATNKENAIKKARSYIDKISPSK